MDTGATMDGNLPHQIPQERFVDDITLERIFSDFRPIPNPCGKRSDMDGYLFKEGDCAFYMIVEALLDTSRRVWTLIECNDNQVLAGWGYHPVNAVMGYLITEIPCPRAGTEKETTKF